MPDDEVPDADLRLDDPAPQAQESPSADVPDTDSGPDASVGEVDEQRDESPHEPAPLEPGGKRFKQVYARAKTAEAQLQQEREARARLEGQLEATRTAPPVGEPKAEPRLTWTQLQAGIQDGKITEVQARDYDRETIKQELRVELNQRLDQELTVKTRTNTVQSQLDDYKATVPEILTPGTPERVKLQAEFDYLVRMGYDAKDPRTDLIALRTTFGDVKVAKERREAKTGIKERETMQDIANSGKPKSDAKDPLKTITGEQRKYYQRMIDKGQYKGWAEVREELAFVPPR
jgi:hypothetical protein